MTPLFPRSRARLAAFDRRALEFCPKPHPLWKTPRHVLREIPHPNAYRKDPS